MTGVRPLPLSGIRVLDFGHIVAGPFCVRLLADLGADVIKVETATRQGRTGARRGSVAGRHEWPYAASLRISTATAARSTSTSRPSAASPSRASSSTRPMCWSRISRSGVMERLGHRLSRFWRKPIRGLVYASMSAFGQSGPRHGWTGMNVTLQACSGLMLATGAESDPPIGISNSWNDYIGGLHAAVAIVGALSKRRTTGEGCHLDVSQFEASVAMIGSLLFASAVTRKPPARLGSRSSTAAPQGCYRCAGEDQWCAISVQSDEQWQKLRALLGGDLRERHAGRSSRASRRNRRGDRNLDRQARPAEVERQLTQARHSRSRDAPRGRDCRDR